MRLSFDLTTRSRVHLVTECKYGLLDDFYDTQYNFEATTRGGAVVEFVREKGVTVSVKVSKCGIRVAFPVSDLAEYYQFTDLDLDAYIDAVLASTVDLSVGSTKACLLLGNSHNEILVDGTDIPEV